VNLGQLVQLVNREILDRLVAQACRVSLAQLDSLDHWDCLEIKDSLAVQD
jgi:hypothetical protein